MASGDRTIARRQCRRLVPWVAGALLVLTAATLPAKDFIIYPSKGQPPELQEKDKLECYTWAKQQSGFDPMAQQAPAPAPKPSGPPPPAAVGAGAAGGAIAGATVGMVTGHHGAAIVGATTGALLGGVRGKQKQASKAQAQQEQVQQQQAALRDGYDRAFAACMQGRGYSLQ